MPINSDKPNLWKEDIVRSVDLYNDWFIRFAPKAYRDTRVQTTAHVETALKQTANLTDISPAVLRSHPTVLSTLRMATAPPIARDRLMGLAGVSPNLVRSMELIELLVDRLLKDSDVIVEHAITMAATRFGGTGNVSKIVLETIQADFRGNWITVVSRDAELVIRQLEQKLRNQQLELEETPSSKPTTRTKKRATKAPEPPAGDEG